jgi:hypothetical protein
MDILEFRARVLVIQVHPWETPKLLRGPVCRLVTKPDEFPRHSTPLRLRQ